LQKQKDSFCLSLSRRLYKPDSIDKSLQDLHLSSKKSKTENKDYIKIKLKAFDLKSTLEFANYLLHLNR